VNGFGPPSGRLTPVLEWLVSEGRLLPDLPRLMEPLLGRVIAAGVPLWRFYLGLQLMHPQLQALGVIWRRDSKVEEIARRHGVQFTAAYIGSPIQELREFGRTVRYRLDSLTPEHHAVLRELREAGGTDYFGLPMRVSRGGAVPVVTAASDAPGGFSDADLADLRLLVDHLGAVVELHVNRTLAETVVTTYLGRHTGQRILQGAIRRGDGEAINAVLWFSDMRDFTGLNERLPPDEMLELLNNYLQLVGDALAAHGGEILKFIGDGVMAIFPVEDAMFLPMVTSNALAAAQRLAEDVEAANLARAAGGRGPIRYGVGLHVGMVTFGNVGTEDRLDFTVIGPAVNRAARLESLTKDLGVTVCASADFRGVCALPMTSLGLHTLKGVPEPVEVFGL